jgi:hypothetical protein
VYGDAVAQEGITRAVPTADWWRPTRSLANWLTWLLAGQAAFQLLSPIVSDQARQFVQWHKAFDAAADGRQHEANRILRNANQGFNTFSLVGLFTIAAMVLLIIWMWRSAHNAHALGRVGERLSPGWTIAAWFVPLANFVLLYILYSDLWRSADPSTSRGDGWRALPGSGTVRAFWVFYVVGPSMVIVPGVLAITGVTDESTTRTLLVAGGILGAVAALLNILVVREITSRQEALQARDPAPTERPLPRTFAAPTTVDGPGWYADPGGRFDHRYWDGGAWTEHVSRGGVAETAPVTPADWYPDPTRRFHWRYWTGHEWTEHVSRDGELFIDPIDDAGSAPPA